MKIYETEVRGENDEKEFAEPLQGTPHVGTGSGHPSQGDAFAKKFSNDCEDRESGSHSTAQRTNEGPRETRQAGFRPCLGTATRQKDKGERALARQRVRRGARGPFLLGDMGTVELRRATARRAPDLNFWREGGQGHPPPVSDLPGEKGNLRWCTDGVSKARLT